MGGSLAFLYGAIIQIPNTFLYNLLKLKDRLVPTNPSGQKFTLMYSHLRLCTVTTLQGDSILYNEPNMRG